MIPTNERISAVDGLRCLAILSVVFYHYCYRFSPPAVAINYYPYEFPSSILRYGYYGVELFFVISGFVIFQTLGNTKKMSDFIIKRLIRLLPSLAICSIITYSVVMFLDSENFIPFLHSKSLWSFIPSLTFIPPGFWNNLMQRSDIGYIDGSYWSLFAEIVFYCFGGLLYFLRPERFLSNWLRLTLFMISIRIVTSPRNQSLFPDFLNSFFDVLYRGYFTLNVNYWVYFALGVFFYSLYSSRRVSVSNLAMVIAMTLLELYFLGNDVLRVLFLGIIALFLILIYRERWLRFLTFKVFIRIGMVSYPLYLLHENVGLILIHKMGMIPVSPHFYQYLPLIVMALMVIFADIIYQFFEKPIIAFLRSRLLNVRSNVI